MAPELADPFPRSTSTRLARLAAISLTALATGFIAGCANSTASRPASATTSTHAADPVIEPEAFAAALAATDDRRVILDCRKLEDFAPAHIAGSRRVDLADWSKLSRSQGGLDDAAAWSDRIGALGIIDNEPRHLADSALASLRDLAGVLESELHRRQLALANGDMIRELGEARRRSMVDPLTSVWNRAGLDTILARELDSASMRGSQLSVAMLDLDYFKQVNDRYGHGVGDTVLSEVARRLRVAARPIDSVARYGGEEFVVVLPGCGSADAQAVAERLRSRIADPAVVVGESLSIDVTASIGVATAEPGEPATVLLTRADVALYDAKRNGRDQVVAAQPSLRAPAPN